MRQENRILDELDGMLASEKSPHLHYLREHRSRFLRLACLLKENHSHGKVLDVGSFPFHLLYLLDRMKYGYVGLDFDIGSAKGNGKFIKKYKLKVKECNIMNDKFPVKNGEFSTVIFTEVIEHLGNPLKPLFEINRSLKLGGSLILSTPSQYGIGKIIKFILGRGVQKGGFENYLQEFTHGYPGHINEYSSFELKNVLARMGFKVKRVSYEYYDLPKKNRIFVPIYLTIPFFRPYQIIVAEKVKDVKMSDFVKPA